MTIKPIKTEEDYEQALELLEQLWDAKEGTEEHQKLEVVSILLDAWENEHYPVGNA